MQDLKNLTFAELKGFLESAGLPQFSAAQIFNWVYKKRLQDFSAMSDLSVAARRFLADTFSFPIAELVKTERSHDGTEKFLFKLRDKTAVETVFIPDDQRGTLCVSTQAGCRWACKLCLSGQSGFERDLDPGEIVGQYLRAAEVVAPRAVTNIVFMGTGEPLDNFDNCVKAIRIFTERAGLALSKRRICISTCGLVPEIKKLSALRLGIKLSISLHAWRDDQRGRIMPVNHKYPIKELMAAAREFAVQAKYPVTFEYVLIKDFNSSLADAAGLASLLKGMDCKVNLIPYNNAGGQCQAPVAGAVEDFENFLKNKHILVTLRVSRGQDIHAACGQLRARFVAKSGIKEKDATD